MSELSDSQNNGCCGKCTAQTNDRDIAVVYELIRAASILEKAGHDGESFKRVLAEEISKIRQRAAEDAIDQFLKRRKE